MSGRVNRANDNKEFEITQSNFDEIRNYLSGSDGADVTGGMVSKVIKMLELSKKGIESMIINGLKENNVKKAILGEDVNGTLIKS